MCIVRSRELIIGMANQPMLAIWNKTADEIINHKLLDVFPEVSDQPFPGLLLSVFDTGLPVFIEELPAVLKDADGSLRTVYSNFTYQPLFDPSGKVESIMATVVDMTSAIQARQKLEESESELQLLNKDLTLLNTEQSTSNQELTAANTALRQTQLQLTESHALLTQNEENLRLTLSAARLGTFNLDLVTSALVLNDRCKRMFGLPPGSDVSFDAIFGTILPEYVSKVQYAIEQAIRDTSITCDVSYEIMMYQRTERKWMRSVGKTLVKADGSVSQFYGIVQDITEQKRDEQRKNDFISMVSHELKTPLTSLGGYLQMLVIKAGKAEDTLQINALSKAGNQVKKMSKMIHSFLDVSRLEAGKIHLDEQLFDIENLVEETVAEARLSFPEHHISFHACHPATVSADRDKIGQVITNFISNAVKYAPKSKVINITCQETGQEVTISVTDYGWGIEP